MTTHDDSAVELLSIGTELLLGETVNTNSAWIGRRLAEAGIRVVRETTVADDELAIRGALAAALQRTRTVLCTGGLGPTSDDLTRAVVASLYERPLHIDEGWLAVLRARYAQRGIPMPEINRVQAEVPEGATLLHNARGTAPGLAVDDARLGLTVLLPGVPGEMRELMEEHVLPLLRERLAAGAPVESRVLRTAGISEALLAERIADITVDVAPLSIAFLPHGSGVDLRLTSWGDAPAAAAAAFARVLPRLRERLAHHVYTEDRSDLATVVGEQLRAARVTLALAESCTGGLLAKRLTDDAGASDYLLAGFVTYSNEAKRDLLGVRVETLALHGAVSEQCAREMAQGARAAVAADIGVSITGIAGPGGGSETKPVGIVWIAVASHAGETTRRFVFLPGDRGEIRERAAQAALDMLRRQLSQARP